jgi:ATP phosphoribosyltransferase
MGSEYRVFLPAADIPRFVALGSVSLGITGGFVVVDEAADGAVI